MSRNTRGWPVMASKCVSCPFGPNGDIDLALKVLERTIGQASQICHHASLAGKRDTHLCRGQRDIQLNMLVAIGALDEATDEAFTKKSRELGVI